MPEPAAALEPEVAAGDLPGLLRGAQMGRSESMTALVRGSRPLITGVARRYLAEPADIDDVVQEVSAKLFLHAHLIRNPKAIGGWIKRVTSNEALTVCHRASRTVVRASLDDVDMEESAEETVLAGLGRRDAVSAVDGAIGRLRPDDARLANLLFGTETPDYRKISTAIGRPLGSIGPTRQRLLARLRDDSALRMLRA